MGAVKHRGVTRFTAHRDETGRWRLTPAPRRWDNPDARHPDAVVFPSYYVNQVGEEALTEACRQLGVSWTEALPS